MHKSIYLKVTVYDLQVTNEIVVLDSRNVWNPINNEIPSAEEQLEHFGGWRLVHKDKTVIDIPKAPPAPRKKSSFTLTQL
jgi:hypothetical protein